MKLQFKLKAEKFTSRGAVQLRVFWLDGKLQNAPRGYLQLLLLNDGYHRQIIVPPEKPELMFVEKQELDIVGKMPRLNFTWDGEALVISDRFGKPVAAKMARTQMFTLEFMPTAEKQEHTLLLRYADDPEQWIEA